MKTTVSSGNVIAIGKVIQSSRAVVVAEAELFNDKKKLIAKDQGNFYQPGQPLTSDIGYHIVANSSEYTRKNTCQRNIYRSTLS